MFTVAVTIIGGLVAIVASREKTRDEMIAWLGKYAFIVGLIFSLWQYGGMRVL